MPRRVRAGLWAGVGVGLFSLAWFRYDKVSRPRLNDGFKRGVQFFFGYVTSFVGCAGELSNKQRSGE